MNPISLDQIESYVERNISEFHAKRIEKLTQLKLVEILRKKNPYLFKVKNINTAQDYIRNILDAFLSSQEEGIFGHLLEELAIFVCEQVYGGKKSELEGMDLEFSANSTYYIVSIKSGPNWGNSDQIKRMRHNFKAAKDLLSSFNPIAVNGCCYGKDNSPDKGDYLKLCGQRFWFLISENSELYADIIEPLGHQAKQKNEQFSVEYANAINRFTLEFLKNFCNLKGEIAWRQIVQFNSSMN